MSRGPGIRSTDMMPPNEGVWAALGSLLAALTGGLAWTITRRHNQRPPTAVNVRLSDEDRALLREIADSQAAELPLLQNIEAGGQQRGREMQQMWRDLIRERHGA